MRFTTVKAHEEDPIIGTYDLPEQQGKRGSAGEGGTGTRGCLPCKLVSKWGGKQCENAALVS